MKNFILITILCLSLSSIVYGSYNKRFLEDWNNFKKQFNKKYSDFKEESFRQMIWDKNMRKIAQHNEEADRELHTYRLKINEFGDLSHKEFLEKLLTFNKKVNLKVVEQDKVKLDIPDSVDWRDKGCVDRVRMQSVACNEIWAYGTTESTAGANCVLNGKYVELSSQQLIDCSRKFGNQGCAGGDFIQSYKYVIATGGLDSEASYPPTDEDGRCQFNPANVACKISKYVEVISGNETDLTIGIANNGPLPVAIDASQSSFQFYSSGIYYEPSCSSEQLDHILILVGYGSVNKDDYYIGKNSWGTNWGENGYVRMSRNRNNNCGIASYSAYPVI